VAFYHSSGKGMRKTTGSIDALRPRILIVRLSAIGDCVLTTPLIHAIRDRYPAAYLAWVVEERAAPLLEGHVGLDELLVVPRGWLTSPRAVLRIRRKLRARRFDFVLDPQSLTKSAVLGWLSGAKKRIGFRSPTGRELAPLLHNCSVPPRGEHLVDRTLGLLRTLGIEHAEAVFELPDYRSGESILDFVHSSCGGKTRFALVNVGAGWPTKLWCPDRFGEVIRHLGREHQLPSIVVWHGPERDLAVEVVGAAGGYGSLAPKTSLTELAVLAKHAALFVGCDSGPLHLAAAVDTPCVGLYGPTRPRRCGPYGFAHLTVEPEGDCEGLKMRSRKANQIMQRIDAGRVCEACDALLGEARQSSSLQQHASRAGAV
jgi:lipopolysaccharide heptosyltransferase I